MLLLYRHLNDHLFGIAVHSVYRACFSGLCPIGCCASFPFDFDGQIWDLVELFLIIVFPLHTAFHYYSFVDPI